MFFVLQGGCLSDWSRLLSSEPRPAPHPQSATSQDGGPSPWLTALRREETWGGSLSVSEDQSGELFLCLAALGCHRRSDMLSTPEAVFLLLLLCGLNGSTWSSLKPARPLTDRHRCHAAHQGKPARPLTDRCKCPVCLGTQWVVVA